MSTQRITLIGSTRFRHAFMEANKRLTASGYVVYSIAFAKELEEVTENEKTVLDLVHFMKIMNSDEVLCLDVNGYVGESTQREILWACLLGIPVKCISGEDPGEYIRDFEFHTHFEDLRTTESSMSS